MKRIPAIVLALVFVLSLASCADTPDTQIVAQKDMDRLIEQGQQTPENNALSDIASGTPENYTWSTSVYNGRVTVNVNAPITLPDADAMPMYQVSAGAFTQEQVDAIIETLYQGKAIYDNGVGDGFISKADYEAEITLYENILDAGPDDPRWLSYAALYDDIDGSGTHVSEAMMRMEFENRIQDAKSHLNTAYEKPSDILKKSDGHLKVAGENTTTSANLYVMDDSQSELLVFNADETSSAWSSLSFSRHKNPNYNLSNAAPAEETEGFSAAKALADGFFEAAGTEVSMLGAYLVDDAVPESGEYKYLDDNGTISNVAPQKATSQAYVFYYTSAADGFPVAFDSRGGGTGAVDKGSTEFEAFWLYEYAYIVVDSDGICLIDWIAPITQREQVSQNTGLLSFDKIRPVFEEMVTVSYEGTLAARDSLGDTDGSYDLKITEISLELIRTRATGGERTGILTPAWVFYGAIGGTDVPEADSGLLPSIILAINAIDGTAIDVMRGY